MGRNAGRKMDILRLGLSEKDHTTCTVQKTDGHTKKHDRRTSPVWTVYDFTHGSGETGYEAFLAFELPAGGSFSPLLHLGCQSFESILVWIPWIASPDSPV